MRIFARGPSQTLFCDFTEALFFDDLNECINEAKMLISGTGWQTDLEYSARKIAKSINIPSIAVLDHWTNYKERFVFNGRELYPDHILVSDRYAEALAQKELPNITITQLSNLWLDNIVNKYKNKVSLKSNFELPTRLLYFTEPYRQKWGDSKLIPEFQALKYFSEKIDLLGKYKLISTINKIESINIRTHPSEDISKYSKFIHSLGLPGDLYINKYETLEDSLLNSQIVFGCETQALVVAQACGLKVVSTIPPWAPKCKLPHDFIIHISNLV